jgi:hypothetical protein
MATKKFGTYLPRPGGLLGDEVFTYTTKGINDEPADTFDTTLGDMKEFIGEVPPHDDLSGLNVGDFQHLTAAEKTNLFAAKGITIGTNGDYATFGAAVIAGALNNYVEGGSNNTFTNIEFISDVTESANITIPNTTPSINGATSIQINGNGYKWNLGNIEIRRSVGDFGFTTFNINNVNVITAKTTGNTTFFTNTVADFRDCTINVTTNTSGFLQGVANDVLYNNCKILLANVAGGGIGHNNAGSFSMCNVVGGGATCNLILVGKVIDSNFSGTFVTGIIDGIRTDNIFIGNKVNITGTFTSSSGKVIGNNITASGSIYPYTETNVFSYNNLNSPGVIHPAGGAATHYIVMDGNRFASTFSQGRQCTCNGNYFIGAVTSTTLFRGTNNVFLSTFSSSNVLQLHGNRFEGNITITGADLSKTISGNIMGNGAAGGGAATLTLSAGVNRAIVKDNHFDNAIVDNSGSGTNIISDNIIY